MLGKDYWPGAPLVEAVAKLRLDAVQEVEQLRSAGQGQQVVGDVNAHMRSSSPRRSSFVAEHQRRSGGAARSWRD